MTRAPTPQQVMLPGFQPIPWWVRVMAFEGLPAVLSKISKLLIKAEKAREAKERAAAIKQLWEIHAKLKAEVTQAEKDTRAGQNRRVEAVAYRATLSTLELELSLLGEEKPPGS